MKNNKKEEKLIVGEVTHFDEERMLHYTYIGVEGKNMPLHYSVYGKTAEESQIRARRLYDILTAHQS